MPDSFDLSPALPRSQLQHEDVAGDRPVQWGTYHIRAFANERANWAAVDLAIELPGANTLGAVTPDSLLRPGEILGVPRRIGERELDRLMRLLPPAIDRLKQQIERENVDLVGPARVFLGGEARLIATIEHVVGRDMLQRLEAVR